MEENIGCEVCSRLFSTRSNLIRHIKSVHKIEIMYDKHFKLFQCLEGCDVSFSTYKNLLEHLQEQHCVTIAIETREFSSIEEFQTYLDEYESSNNVNYRLSRGKQVIGDWETRYYDCARSGKVRKSYCKLGLRKEKAQGSKKINAACTSRIKLTKHHADSTVFMEHYKTHYGHDIELKHLKISKKDQTLIAQKLHSGVPMSRVLDEFRGKANTDKLRRINLLTRKDLHNIKSTHEDSLREEQQMESGNEGSASSSETVTSRRNYRKTNLKRQLIRDVKYFVTNCHNEQRLRRVVKAVRRMRLCAENNARKYAQRRRSINDRIKRQKNGIEASEKIEIEIISKNLKNDHDYCA